MTETQQYQGVYILHVDDNVNLGMYTNVLIL